MRGALEGNWPRRFPTRQRRSAAQTLGSPFAPPCREKIAPLLLLLAISGGWTCLAAEPAPQAPVTPRHTAEIAIGKVVFLAPAMEQATGARAVPEARERILALQTAAGNYIPLLEDVRGRAFRTDERLRQMQVKLWLRRYEGFPLAQILRVVELAPDGEFEIDYWCDVCAIALFEQKECDCCQGPVVLRRRKLSDVQP